MAIVIVFTIYKNGGNAGVLGASFGCEFLVAVDRDRCGRSGSLRSIGIVAVQAETMARGNAGFNAGRSVVRSVLRNAPDI